MAQIQTLEALAAALRTKLPEQRDFYVVNTRRKATPAVNLRQGYKSLYLPNAHLIQSRMVFSKLHAG